MFFIVSLYSVHGDGYCHLSHSRGCYGSTSCFSHVSARSILPNCRILIGFCSVFLEVAGKRTFLGMVGFELSWVGLFGMMTLSELGDTIVFKWIHLDLSSVGASLITSQSSKELCVPPSIGETRVMFVALQ